MAIGWIYVWSQILTVIEYSLLALSYQAKKRLLAVVLDILSMTMGVLAYLLLGADLGLGMSLVILVANFYYLYQEKHPRLRRRRYWWDYVVLGVILTAIVVITFFTHEGWMSLLSVAATVLYEISIWQKSTKVYKFLGMPVALCWMLYNAFVGSAFGVICEAAVLGSSIGGYVNEVERGKKQRKRR